MAIVTPDLAQKHLRLDEITDEVLVYIDAAEEFAQEFLNRSVYADEVPLDDETGIVANGLIIAAILLILGHLYENREAVTNVTLSSAPLGALNLLQPYRVGMGV